MGLKVGQPVHRIEDARFMTGRGRYTDDINLPDQAHAVILRSPHAHARLVCIDTGKAESIPGVLAVLTGADFMADGIRALPSYTRDPRYAYKNRDGTAMPDPPYWPLARGKVRHVGDPVVLVVAESTAKALDAAALIEVDYEPLAVATDVSAALTPGTPRIWEEMPGNVCFEWENGDCAAKDAAFAGAAHVTRMDLVNNRLIVAFMEPRAAIGHYDPESGKYTLYVGSQGPHRFRATLSEVLGIPAERLRVVTPDVGGGFGPRGFLYPEYVLVTWAARRVARPVKWTADRSESFVTDLQARDQVIRCELALDEDGRFLGLGVSSDMNIGAYIASRSIYAIIVHMAPIITGTYHFGAMHFELRGVVTNTVPLYALRGIGRAEATHILERLIDTAAAETGIERIALRRRNLIPVADMPYAALSGATYDSGAFERNMDLALEIAMWQGFDRRREESRRNGRLRGIGLANYIENAGGAPSEYAEVSIGSDGVVTLSVGTQSTGQGHDTVYTQVLADQLELPFDSIRVVSGDTEMVRAGYGSSASRSMRKAGAAIVVAARDVLEKGRELAGEILEAAPADIEYADGRYRVAGTDYSIGLFEAAGRAAAKEEVLSAAIDHQQPTEAYPNGCHIAEVEIDPETGRVSLVAHAMVNDAGRPINTLLLDGQLHGGIAQGVGQALLERCIYSADSGQLLSGSFMDYAVPRADDVPQFVTRLNVVPYADNPLGVKGAGEGGATGAPAAVMNAIVDALRAHGVRDIDMPATPERIWRAIHAGD